MNKSELIDHIAKQADISKAASGRALEALIGAVRQQLKKGNEVTLVGFGTFAVGKRAARTGRNPRTGESIKIKAAKDSEVPSWQSTERRDQLNREYLLFCRRSFLLYNFGLACFGCLAQLVERRPYKA